MAESRPFEGHAREGTQRFPAVCSTLTALLSDLADGSVVETHALMDTHCFRGRSSNPGWFTVQTWADAVRVERTHPEGLRRVQTGRARHMRASQMAEGSAHDAHTPSGATRLAGGPSPWLVYLPQLEPDR